MSDPQIVERPTSATTTKSRHHLLCLSLLALLILVLAVRFAWIASATETGWETIKLQWYDATVGLFAGPHIPVGSLDPADQATFWLRETERIVADDRENAELAMSAALMLDSPGNGYIYRYMIPPERKFKDLPPEVLGFIGPQVDYKALARAVDSFEDRCRERCLALVAKATKLQPEEPRWWRLRAMLLFRGQPFANDHGPRDSRWLDLLEQCKVHDPDNALYDYLAAWQLWEEGIDTSSLNPSIVDRAKFERGIEYFLHGEKKKILAAGGDESALVIELLLHSNIPSIEYEGVTAEKSMLYRLAFMMRDIQRVNSFRAERRERAGDLAGALAVRRQTIHMFDQLDRSGDAIAFDYIPRLFRKSNLSSLQQFLENHPELVPAEELERIEAATKEAEREGKELLEAGKRLAARQNPPNAPFFVAKGLLSGAALQSIISLLVIGACAFTTAKLLGTSHKDDAPLGAIRHAVVWVVGYLLTFVALGMAPAGIISPAVQEWIAPASLAVLLTLGLGWMFWKIVVQYKSHPIIRTLLGLALICILLTGMLWISGAIPSRFSEFSWPLHVPPRGWHNFPAGLLQETIAKDHGTWIWAGIQWMKYWGPFVSIGVSLALLALWHCIRFHRTHSPASHRRRDRWSGLFACLGRSALVAATIWILVYLWIMPNILQISENVYQTKMAQLRNPRAYYESINKTMSEVGL